MAVTLRASLPPADPVLDLLLSGAPAGRALFPGGRFADEAALARRLAHLDGARQGRSAPASPKAVQTLLQAENAFAPLHPSQEAALDLAGKHGTAFILTGQQPGLLGGPVLWLYKALTAAALADQCTRRLGRPVLPIFWVAGDDSDLAECNHLELLEPLPPDLPSVLSLPFADPARPLSVAARPLAADAVEALLADLARLWKPGTVEAARESLVGAVSLADAFLRLAQRWLGPRGALFLSGHSPRVRAAMRPALERAVANRRGLEASLERGTAALAAAGCEPQVALRPGTVHAFALKDGERHRLLAEPRPDGHADRLYLPATPGADLAAASLELSHDVFTRPLGVETLLPVLGHVLGPAELRYFAQLAPAFLEETGDMPLLHPRMTAVALPEASAAAFGREGIALADLPALKPTALRARLMEKAWKSHPAAVDLPGEPPGELLAGLRRAHVRHFRDTGPLDRLERALGSAWKRYLATLGRMAYAGAAGGLSARANPASAPSAHAGHADLFRALRWLGNGAGQDRHLNLHSLLDAVGPPGFEALLAAADPAEPGLRIFTYPEEGKSP